MFEGLEKRVGKKGNISYWDGDTIVGKRCTKCGKDKEISCFTIRDKKKNIYRSECKECKNEYTRKFYNTHEHARERQKQYRETHKDFYQEYQKQWWEKNKNILKPIRKQYNEENKEYIKEQKKQYYIENKEQINKRNRKYYIKNREKEIERGKEYNKKHSSRLKIYWKRYREEHSEKYRKNSKEHNEKDRKENIKYLTNILEQVNPVLKKLNIEPYGSIYKVTHKNGHCYIGQTVHSLKERYGIDVIQGWIEERKEKETQKFLEELIKDDLTIEIIDIGVCKYHLDKLEAYWIDFYDSFQNGYNNNSGYYKREDGIEEFNQILLEHNLEFINGELRRIV